MKKILIIAAGLLGAAGLFGAEDSSSASNLSLDTSVKFQSDYAYRGRRELRKAVLTSAEIGYAAFQGGTIYVGADAALGIEKETFGNRVSPYLGVTYDITDIFSVDAGYAHNFHTSLKTETGGFQSFYKRNTSEFYAGVIADVILTPSLYLFYDVGRKEIAVEGEVGHSFDLSQYSINGLSIDLGAKLGYDSARRPYGQKYNADEHHKKNYFYYGISADLVYGVTSNAKAKIGVAYEGNSAKKDSWVYESSESTGKHKGVVWFNASIDCSF
jgi:hypothetical protein